MQIFPQVVVHPLMAKKILLLIINLSKKKKKKLILNIQKTLDIPKVRKKVISKVRKFRRS